MKTKLLNRIETNPVIMFGKPVIKGSRLPVEIILEKLAYGVTEDEILKEYPFLKKEDIKAALLYAARTLSLEEVMQA
ncbi:MAG: antitoxin [Nitrospirae bacterium GWC2_42_7]|nr:MAG: antitoxin [Nitrospirae bacterium GWC2_42_7]